MAWTINPTVRVNHPNGAETEHEVEVELTMDHLPDSLHEALRQAHALANEAMSALPYSSRHYKQAAGLRDKVEEALEEMGESVTKWRMDNWPGYAEHIADRAREATEPDPPEEP